MVVDVLMLMDKHIVRVHKTIVVDDANFVIIHIIMSIYTIVRIIIMVKNKLTLFSMNERHHFILILNKINKKFHFKQYT